MLARPPVLRVLRPYVRLLWAGVVGPVGAPCLEHVLPTGCMHLAVRLSGPPLRLYAGADASAEEVGLAVIGGARAGPYLREAGTGGLGVGAQLEPGAARALFGAAASAFTGRHTRLEDAWGRHAQAALEQLHAARGPRECLDTLERLLLEGLRPGPAFRLTEPGGRIGHAELDFGGAVLMLSEEYPELGIQAPAPGAPTPVSLHIQVDDADAVLARAVAAGATLERPAQDEFYGERGGLVRDPFGHRWNIGHEIERLTPEEMQRRYDALMKG